MILVTGGLGFIGSHTVQALLDLGEGCVLVQRRTAEVPASLADAQATVEQADITDLTALLDVGTRHKITGIVHLAGSMPWPPSPDQPVEGARKAIGGLFNVIEAAQV
jgi:UDP-glucose 4-epimerase